MKLEDLRKNNGRESSPCYVVNDGKVYDLSSSKLWKKGVHLNRHQAGEDLSEFLVMAPHGPEMLERFEVVGQLEDQTTVKDDTKERLRTLYSTFHPHPILLHYPMGAIPFGALMLALYLVTKNASFESAAFYALFFGTVTLVPVILAGILSWWINYEMMLTNIFKVKLTAAAFGLIFCTTAVILRFSFPDLNTGSGVKIFYYLSYFASLPCLFLAAFEGGKITWPA